MKCNKCGLENQEGKFCTNCGNKLEETPTEVSEGVNVEKTNSNANKGLATASLVIGIISLVFSIFVNILIIPLALTGLILGIVGLVKKQKATVGVVLSSISIFLSLLIFLFLFKITNEHRKLRNYLIKYNSSFALRQSILP